MTSRQQIYDADAPYRRSLSVVSPALGRPCAWHQYALRPGSSHKRQAPCTCEQPIVLVVLLKQSKDRVPSLCWLMSPPDSVMKYDLDICIYRPHTRCLDRLGKDARAPKRAVIGQAAFARYLNFLREKHPLRSCPSSATTFPSIVSAMDEEENIDIAAAMGFGSFGGTKKRKYDQASSPKSKADASGANSTKLGVRTKKTAGPEALQAANQTEGTLSQTPLAIAKSLT